MRHDGLIIRLQNPGIIPAAIHTSRAKEKIMDLTAIQLRSTVTQDGHLELALVDRELGEPAANEVVVRVEATPINPSDLGLLIGPADLRTLAPDGTTDRPTLEARIPDWGLPGLKSRIGKPMPIGNEGAGTVVRAGADAAHLLGLSRRDARRRHVRDPAPAADARLRRPARGRQRGGRRVDVREPADRARLRRDDASREAPRDRAHRGRLQSRPDAQPHLPQGRDPPSSRSFAARLRPGCSATRVPPMS